MSWYLSSDQNFILLLRCVTLRPFQRRLAQLAAVIVSIVICLPNFFMKINFYILDKIFVAKIYSWGSFYSWQAFCWYYFHFPVMFHSWDWDDVTQRHPRSWGKIFTAPIWTIWFKVHKRGFELMKNTPLPASVHIINTVKNWPLHKNSWNSTRAELRSHPLCEKWCPFIITHGRASGFYY